MIGQHTGFNMPSHTAHTYTLLSRHMVHRPISNARRRAGPRRVSIANAFEPDDRKQTVPLVIMC